MSRHIHVFDPALEKGYIPCCVPGWDQQDFFRAGGLYTPALGFHVLANAYLDPVNEWLPRKWQYRGNPRVPSLLPDMLPSSTWESNLRHLLSDAEWDRLRKFCYRAAGNTCKACGSRGEPHVEAHESWSFDENTLIQRLTGLVCLCPTCHKAKHLGYANRLGRLPQVLAKLKWLNEWNDAQLKTELKKVEDRQVQLSMKEWSLDLSFLHSYGVR